MLKISSSQLQGSRKYQQDACGTYESDDAVVAIVCDGLGSNKNSGQVSEQFVRVFLDQFRELNSIKAAFEATVTIAYTESWFNNKENYPAGTTVSIVSVTKQRIGYEYEVLGLGDSPVFLYKKVFKPTSSKSNRVQTIHDSAYLNNCVGGGCRLVNALQFNNYRGPLGEGDAIYVCSDGVQVYQDDNMLIEALYDSPVELIVANAAARTDSDNVTMIKIEVE